MTVDVRHAATPRNVIRAVEDESNESSPGRGQAIRTRGGREPVPGPDAEVAPVTGGLKGRPSIATGLRAAASPEGRILTPDQRVRVFVSSTLNELADERAAVRRAIERLRLTPVMFELGARPYPPRSLYMAYLQQSHVFVGIYGEQYGWVGPGMDVSGLEDELRHAGDMPLLLYIKTPAPRREPRLSELITGVQRAGGASYKTFTTAQELETQVVDDLALLLTERFAPSAEARPEVRMPHPASEFIGRSSELGDLVELLTSDGVRLVTLTGPGGIGKTRLAIEVARAVADRFPDGVTFVPLAARGPDDFLEAVGTAVGLNDLGQKPLPQLLVAHLRDRYQLIVLDNFERLLPAAAEVARLIEQTVALRVLITSRTALRLSGEEEFPVPPLLLPRVTNRVEEVARADAAQLFSRRVAAVRHGYRITERDAAIVARICRRLDGLPLALELLAARANVMSVEELATRLDKVLDLSARFPDVPERQRTLRQTMEWSYSQLPPDAGEVFAQLGVFVGSFSLAAAEAVCEVAQGGDVLDVLAVLADHSLLRPQLDTGMARFSMLEIVREYARSLLEPATYEATADRHADYYRDVAAAAFTGLRGSGQRAMIAQLDLDADDIAAALDWLLARDRRMDVADMCWSLWMYYWLRNSLTEGRRWTGGALSAKGPLPELQRGRLLAADAFLATWRADLVLAGDELSEALAIGERERDDDLQLLVSTMLIIVVAGLGDEARARSFAADALRLARAHHDRWTEAVALIGLCWLNAAVGRFDGEQATFEAMFTAARETQDPLWVALALENMAEFHMWRGRVSEAASLLVDSLTMLAELKMAYSGAASLRSAAWLLRLAGDWAGAVRVESASNAVMEAMTAGMWPLLMHRSEQLLSEARQRLGDADYEAAWATGHEWTFEQATAQAIAALSPLVGEAARLPTAPRNADR